MTGLELIVKHQALMKVIKAARELMDYMVENDEVVTKIDEYVNEKETELQALLAMRFEDVSE